MKKRLVLLAASAILSLSMFNFNTVKAKSVTVGPMSVQYCPYYGAQHIAHKEISYPYLVWYKGVNQGYFSKAACECGAELFYNGQPFRSVSPYVGSYFSDYTIGAIYNNYRVITANNMFYTDSSSLVNWYFPTIE